MATTRYRDTRTGRFIKKSTWKRAKSRGSSRYKRETTKKLTSQSRKQLRQLAAEHGVGSTFRVPTFDEDDYFGENYEADEEEEY